MSKNNIYSMTGFGNVSIDTEIGTLEIELRAVNSRFLDFNYFATTDKLRSLEPAVRKLISDNNEIKRGKIECKIYISNRNSGLDNENNIDLEAVKAIKALSKRIHKITGAKNLTVGEILALPGVLKSNTDISEETQTELFSAVERCIDKFNLSRAVEGIKLTEVLLNQCNEIERLVNVLKPKVPSIIEALKVKLQARLDEALTDNLGSKVQITREEISDRIRMEVTLFATKIDVAEEMDRLLTHVYKIRKALDEGGPVGRKLDFIIQELNREANTLASKASAIEMTDTAVNLKVVIEQMREQIQNLQ